MAASYRRETLQYLAPSGLYRMAYLEWGDPANARVLVCVHGLTRCARDFDFLAGEFCSQYRVVCPDVPGRGESDWLDNPMEYVTPTYLQAMVALVARLGVSKVDWLGTSMGGLIGMFLAALPRTPVARLVLNDVGPVISAAALERIGNYVGMAPRFASLDAAEQYVRQVSAPFGRHTDAQWRFLTEHVVRPDGSGGYRMHYDPAIAVPFKADQERKDIDLWKTYDAVHCPTLLVRGEHSDLLSRETAAAMGARGPRAQVIELTGVGHAPTFMHPEQVGLVRDFLRSS